MTAMLTDRQRRVLQLMAEGRELVRVMTDSGLRYATVAGHPGKIYDRTVDPLIAEGLIARNRAVPGSRAYFRITDAGRAAAAAKDRAAVLVGVLAQVEAHLEAGAAEAALIAVKHALGRAISRPPYAEDARAGRPWTSRPDAKPAAPSAPAALERAAS